MLPKASWFIPFRTCSIINIVFGIIWGIVLLGFSAQGLKSPYFIEASLEFAASGCLLFAVIKYNQMGVVANLAITSLLLLLNITFLIILPTDIGMFMPEFDNNCTRIHLHDPKFDCHSWELGIITTSGAVFVITLILNIFFMSWNYNFYQELIKRIPVSTIENDCATTLDDMPTRRY